MFDAITANAVTSRFIPRLSGVRRRSRPIAGFAIFAHAGIQRPRLARRRDWMSAVAGMTASRRGTLERLE